MSGKKIWRCYHLCAHIAYFLVALKQIIAAIKIPHQSKSYEGKICQLHERVMRTVSSNEVAREPHSLEKTLEPGFLGREERKHTLVASTDSQRYEATRAWPGCKMQRRCSCQGPREPGQSGRDGDRPGRARLWIYLKQGVQPLQEFR